MKVSRSVFASLVALSLSIFARAAEATIKPALPEALSTEVLPGDASKQVDALFKPWSGPDSPGAAVAVIAHGKVVYEKGFGVANLEYGIPIKPDTIFHVASVSKQFTAMAIVLLEEDGRLSLEDDIRKYLPELPDYGRKITIRNLLQHTGGIRDQWQVLGLAGWSLEDVITQDQILRLIFRQQELNFPPGTKHLYSNGGFTLLAEIVSRVGGKPFPEFCMTRIFAPLGMTHTHFHQDLTQLVPGRAYSYHKKGEGYAASPLNYANVGATSLFTTAGDLVKWLDNFRDPRVGGPAAVARLQEQCVLTDGTKIDYALGLTLGVNHGLRTLSHGGADAGYRSQVLWFPDQELGIAVASNLAGFNANQAANQIAAIYLAGKMTPEPPKPAPVVRKFITVGPKVLETYGGVYPLPKITQTFRAVLKEGKLWAGPAESPAELKPTGPGRFYIEQIKADVEFTALPDGGMKVKVTQPGAYNEGERVPAQPDTAADLAPFAGVYWSEELETQYTFTVKDGKLVGVHAHHGEFQLVPMAKDQFETRLWFAPEVRFVRDAADKIVAVTLGGGRVTAVRFVRK
jgi:CubicO group peptidase (beta-lactamase class C family)